MSLDENIVEVPARNRQGRLLVGVGPAKVVATWRARPEYRETMGGRLEVGIDRHLTGELSAGMVVALAPDGSGSVRLIENLGQWDELSSLGPLTCWLAEWAREPYIGETPYHVTRHAA